MEIKQFYDKGLAHGSYAILSKGEVALVDPARDPQPYYDFAREQNASIKAVIETHPHADFVSSHGEIAAHTGATIYASKLTGADYPHKFFDDGDELKIGGLTLKAINTPGHSPDSISILLNDETGKQVAVFTGDTLFVGDVGRPDLRENVGALTAKREQLAKQMYDSTRNKLMKLNDDTLVYPAHGPGSLCGKAMSSDLFSTIGREKKENYALQDMDEETFVGKLLEDQPFIPKYFGFDVNVNKSGAQAFAESVIKIPRLNGNTQPAPGALVVDTRPGELYRKGHHKGAINIMDGLKFETWLGSIVNPEEAFYLIAVDIQTLESVIAKAAKIGYEKNIIGGIIAPKIEDSILPEVDVEKFNHNPDNFTIVDIRNDGEVKEFSPFENSIKIPLHQLRERIAEIPAGKPVLVHCAGGYRSAAGASIISSVHPDWVVYDLGEAIKTYS